MRALLIAVILLVSAGSAEAYPHWQFTSGTTRCAACHYSPSGGGLISGYGRDQAGEELASFGGDGNFLHGVGRVMPDWLAVGGDLRGAFVYNEVQDPDGPTVAAFPMQAELVLRVELPAGLSVLASGGVRAQVRQPDELVPEQNYQPVDESRFVSREHFVMFRRQSKGPYVKAGRFFVPFGLRLAEHTLWIRRDLGFNLMEEPYSLTFGQVTDDEEIHLSAFVPDELRHMGGNESGVAAFYERQLFDHSGAVGAQAKLGVGEGVNRWIFGTVGKKQLGDALLLAEVDLVVNDFHADAVGTTTQLVGLAGASYLPVRGLVVSAYLEHQQTDLRVSNSRSEATSLLVSFFPYSHVELQVMGRLQFPAGGDVASTLFAQIHYFL